MSPHAPKSEKVLMLCYYYPPYGTSGTTRSLCFSRNLPEYDWEPLVLSVSQAKDRWVAAHEPIPDTVCVERSWEWNLTGLADLLHGITCRLFRLFGVDLKRNYYREILCVPDPQIAWFSTWKGLRLIRSCSAIYVSCSPFSSALSGCLIKLIARKPLIVDFRDVWAIDAHEDRTAFRKWYQRIFEKIVVSYADRLIVNTPGAERLYRQHYPEHAEKICAIPNGYDRIDRATKEERDKDFFVIAHIGTFYGERSPTLLLSALAEINNPGIRLLQIGAPFEIPEEFRGAVNIEFTGMIPRDEALSKMRTASLLYLKQRRKRGEQEYVAVAAKTYEYLATGLPVLVDCPPGDNAQLVEQYGVHRYIVTSQSKEELKAAVLEAFAARDTLEPEISEAFIQTFDRKNLTRKLAAVFDEVCG